MFKIKYNPPLFVHILLLTFVLTVLCFANSYLFIHLKQQEHFLSTAIIIFSTFLYSFFCYSYFKTFLAHSKFVTYIHKNTGRIYDTKEFDDIKNRANEHFFNTQDYLVFVILKNFSKNKLEYNLSISYMNNKFNHHELLLIADRTKKQLIELIKKKLDVEPTHIDIVFEEYIDGKLKRFSHKYIHEKIR